MDSMLRGLVIGQIVGDTIARNRAARPRWGAVAYSPTTGMAWAWNHRRARHAEKAAMRHCQGPQARLWACGADIAIAVARGPRGAFSCKGAHPSVVTLACEGAVQTAAPPTHSMIPTAVRCGWP